MSCHIQISLSSSQNIYFLKFYIYTVYLKCKTHVQVQNFVQKYLSKLLIGNLLVYKSMNKTDLFEYYCLEFEAMNKWRFCSCTFLNLFPSEIIQNLCITLQILYNFVIISCQCATNGVHRFIDLSHIKYTNSQCINMFYKGKSGYSEMLK